MIFSPNVTKLHIYFISLMKDSEEGKSQVLEDEAILTEKLFCHITILSGIEGDLQGSFPFFPVMIDAKISDAHHIGSQDGGNNGNGTRMILHMKRNYIFTMNQPLGGAVHGIPIFSGFSEELRNSLGLFFLYRRFYILQ